MTCWGSSPLARGLPPPTGAGGHATGIIPARAGFTARQPSRCRQSPDHPRSRGVYRYRGRSGLVLAGSSPLARGLQPEVSEDCRQPGIIPARAGFTRRLSSRRTTTRDHPRSRGVYLRLPPPGTGGAGSSPLARGLRPASSRPPGCCRIIPARAGFTAQASPRSPQPRIIPARAGFTSRRLWRSCLAWDHPRSRGVYPVRRAPPRVLLGIIPARAGFTYPLARPAQDPRDHPRSRGVYPHSLPAVFGTLGSSPLARGLHPRLLFQHQRMGIIPARAGFTAGPRVRIVPPQDHPRSRGVYLY